MDIIELITGTLSLTYLIEYQVFIKKKQTLKNQCL